MRLLEEGSFWATAAADGTHTTVLNLGSLPRGHGRLRTDAHRAMRLTLENGFGMSIDDSVFQWLEDPMTVNGGVETATLGPTVQAPCVGVPGSVVTKRVVYATIKNANGEDVRIALRTVNIYGRPGDPHTDKLYELFYTQDIDKLPTLRS